MSNKPKPLIGSRSITIVEVLARPTPRMTIRLGMINPKYIVLPVSALTLKGLDFMLLLEAHGVDFVTKTHNAAERLRGDLMDQLAETQRLVPH